MKIAILLAVLILLLAACTDPETHNAWLSGQETDAASDSAFVCTCLVPIGAGLIVLMVLQEWKSHQDRRDL